MAHPGDGRVTVHPHLSSNEALHEPMGENYKKTGLLGPSDFILKEGSQSY